MKDQSRYVLGGVALGAIVGALIGWAYHRAVVESASSDAVAKPLNRQGAARLAWSVLGVIRQIMELG